MAYTDVRLSNISVDLVNLWLEYQVEFYDDSIETWVLWPERVIFYLVEPEHPKDPDTGEDLPFEKNYFDYTAQAATANQLLKTNVLNAIRARAGIT